METYAEILQKQEKEKMSNYDMDELRRQGKVPNLEKRKEFAEDIIESKTHSVRTRELEINLPAKDCLKLALAAHDRDITLNQLIINVLTDSLKDLDYKFEHNNKPQFLAENIEEY